MYDVDLASAIMEIKRLKARIVALQVPEGLKKRAYQFAEDIENKAGAEVVVLAEPCFGACDVPRSPFALVDDIVNIRPHLLAEVGNLIDEAYLGG